MRHSQRLQARDAEPRREHAREEREDCGAGLAHAGDVADRGGEQPPRKDLRRVVHEDRVDGPEDHAD